MHVPAHLQEIKERLALRSWVDGSDFPRDVHFESIEQFKGLLERHQSEDEDGPELNSLLAAMIGIALNSEGHLLTYVLGLETDFSIDDEAVWGKVCLAAGWVVLQRYERECKSGDETAP